MSTLSLSFILCFEIFFQLLHYDMYNNLLKAYQPRGGPVISYMFFMDDCILLAWIKVREDIILKSIL